MAAAKPLAVVVAFLLAAAAAVPLPDGGGNLPYTLHPAEPPAVSLPKPNAGGDLPAEPPAAAGGGGGGAGCRGSVGMCPARDEAPSLGAGAGASTMSADLEPVRRRVHHQQRDSVPCSRRGASYYNCQSGPKANPYRRACSRIKHCHG